MFARLNDYIERVVPGSRTITRREMLQDAMRTGALILLANMIGAVSSMLILTWQNSAERVEWYKTADASAHRTDQQIRTLTTEVIQAQRQQSGVLESIALSVETMATEGERLGRAATKLGTKADAATRSAEQAARAVKRATDAAQHTPQPKAPARQTPVATQPPQPQAQKTHPGQWTAGSPYKN